MKKERLDQILLRKGLVNDKEIKQALMRQKSHGGRLGSHLLYYRSISEKQLVHALADQFGVPAIELSGQQIADEVIKKIPEKTAEEYQILPFKFEQKTRTLYLAMLDPDNTEAISLAKQASRALDVKPHVAAEIVLCNMIKMHYREGNKDLSVDQVIELPDLFEEEEKSLPQEEPEQSAESPANSETRNILMVTRAAFLKNLLVSIFEREGYNLHIVSQPEQIADALHENLFDYILLSENMEEDFVQWINNGDIPNPHTEVSLFSTVSSALLDNPVPYNIVSESLIKVVQQMSTYRCSKNAWRPPYALIAKDIGELASSLGLRRIAVDGLKITANLLIPFHDNSKESPITPSTSGMQFLDFKNSLAIAKSLDFPWDIEACLRSFSELISGKAPQNQSTEKSQELTLATQILTLVWYRHFAFAGMEGSPETILESLKSTLREKEGRLFSSEVVETYMRILEQRKKQSGTTTQNDVFIVSEQNDISTQFITHLKKAGFRVVEIDDFSEVKQLYDRHRPDIILINYDCYPNHAMKFCRSVRQNSITLFYAFTERNKPSLIMSLLDSGFNDVFVPPFNYNIIVARISKSLTVLAEQDSASDRQHGFSGTFQELPFMNLVQALSMSQRNVHINLERETGENADIYMREGQMVYSKYGEIDGVEAIYKIISWQEEGLFKTDPVTEFPPDNISLPNDFILMEGCRLLDEEKS